MIIYIFILGLAVGSFVNAMVGRMIAREDFVRERSKCDHCEHQLAWYDLIPVLSWTLQRGRCRYCKKKLSPTHPVFELFSAAVFTTFYIFWPFTLAGSDLAVFVLWQIVLTMFMALFLYDLREYELPDSYLLVIAITALMINLFNFELNEVLIGVLAGGGFFHLLHKASGGEWIGFGDVKMGYVVGFLLGGEKIIIGTVLGFYIAALYVLPLMAIKKLNRKSKVPFGPFLIAGYYLSFLFSQTITDWFNGILI